MGSKRIGMRLMGSFIVAAAVLTACSDPSTSPSASALKVSQASFALNDVVTGPPATPVLGEIIVCKTGDEGGTFALSRTAVGASTGTVQNPLAVAVSTCRVAAIDNGGDLIGSNVTLTENPSADLTGITCVFQAAGGSPGACSFSNGGTIFLNSFHAYVITFNNVAPPPGGCTFTKGWYRNKGTDDVTATVAPLDARSKADNQAIMNATPGQPGNVTWGTNNKPNDLLNLYQQYLAAVFNGGQTGPAAVQAAITAVSNGTGGTGTNITSTLTSAQISSLITTLTSFNEGSLPGFPHCGDEVLPS